MQVMEYFTEIQSILQELAFVESANVEYDAKSKSIGIASGSLEMIDSSTLQFLELIHIEGDKITRPKYRFHFMDANEEMLFRLVRSDNNKANIKLLRVRYSSNEYR